MFFLILSKNIYPICMLQHFQHTSVLDVNNLRYKPVITPARSSVHREDTADWTYIALMGTKRSQCQSMGYIWPLDQHLFIRSRIRDWPVTLERTEISSHNPIILSEANQLEPLCPETPYTSFPPDRLTEAIWSSSPVSRKVFDKRLVESSFILIPHPRPQNTITQRTRLPRTPLHQITVSGTLKDLPWTRTLRRGSHNRAILDSIHGDASRACWIPAEVVREQQEILANALSNLPSTFRSYLQTCAIIFKMPTHQPATNGNRSQRTTYTAVR